MTNDNENILSEEIKPLLLSYFIYREENPYFKKAIDDYFLNIFNTPNATCDNFNHIVNLAAEYIFHELNRIISAIFIRIDSSDVDLANRDIVLELIENEVKYSQLNIDKNTIESIASFYCVYFLSRNGFEYLLCGRDGRPPIISTIASSIISKYIMAYNDYIYCFLADMIFESGYKFNSDTFNKIADGRKGKRGPIKKNIETKKLVSAITSATVEKYPSASDHKLTQAIQKHLSSKNIDNSYNTIKKWVKEHREKEGTTCNREEPYKGVISLVIP